MSEVMSNSYLRANSLAEAIDVIGTLQIRETLSHLAPSTRFISLTCSWSYGKSKRSSLPSRYIFIREVYSR